MWHVAPESKIQLVNCELSQKFPLGHLSLSEIRAIVLGTPIQDYQHDITLRKYQIRLPA